MPRPFKQSKHSAANMRVIDAFIDEIEENVQNVAADIAKDTLKTLFLYSPHIAEGGQAKSEYDANHKVSINGQAVSSHISPTFNKSISKTYNKSEQSKVNRNKKKAKHYSIRNNTDHAINVETGLGWANTRGYKTYQKAIQYIKRKYKNVLK